MTVIEAFKAKVHWYAPERSIQEGSERLAFLPILDVIPRSVGGSILSAMQRIATRSELAGRMPMLVALEGLNQWL